MRPSSPWIAAFRGGSEMPSPKRRLEDERSLWRVWVEDDGGGYRYVGTYGAPRPKPSLLLG